jgi:UDP-N-acetylglucosamine acyltransferase
MSAGEWHWQYNHLIQDHYYFLDGKGNKIHKTAHIGTGISIGSGNYIGAFCNIVGDTQIGDNNHFSPFCSIGSEPEHARFFSDKSIKGVKIGSNNIFREKVIVNSGCYRDTVIGNYVWLMNDAYVAHDCIVCDKATISAGVLIGGHCILGEDVNIGLGAMLHQFTVIGSGAMVGMGAVITKTKKIQPLETYVGNPAKYLKPNSYKVEKLSEAEILRYSELYLAHLEMNKI